MSGGGPPSSARPPPSNLHERRDQPLIGVALTSLDDGQALTPQAQIFVKNRFAWLCGSGIKEFPEWADT